VSDSYGRWPNPADSSLDRARAIARDYRAALLERDRAECLRLDNLARYVGQGWVAPRVSQFEPDDLLTARQAADYCDIRPTTLQQWKARGLKVIETADGRRYRVQDLNDYRASRRVKRRTRARIYK
jgi:hypothetical protein